VDQCKLSEAAPRPEVQDDLAFDCDDELPFLNNIKVVTLIALDYYFLVGIKRHSLNAMDELLF
jgi:hypothetical protein